LTIERKKDPEREKARDIETVTKITCEEIEIETRIETETTIIIKSESESESES